MKSENIHGFEKKGRINNSKTLNFDKNPEIIEDTQMSNYDYVYMYDRKGKISFASFGGARVLGLKPNDVIGKTWNELGLQQDVVNAFNLQLEVVFKTGRPLIGENKFPSINGEKDYEYIMHPIPNVDGNIERVECTVKDITFRKHAEYELRRKMMKYNIEDGKIYVGNESQPFEPIKAFESLLKLGYNGLVISRNTEKDFKKIEIDGEFEFFWLTESSKNKTLPPVFSDILAMIETQVRKTAVLIERIDYLIFKNGFKKTISFIQLLKEIVAITGIVIIISIDPATLNEQEMKLFENELDELKSRFDFEKLPKKLFEIVNNIHQEKLKGSESSYSSICKQLGISKPTVRKRVRSLISDGYLLEIEKGRNKFVELTELGWSLMSG